ncbi:hypothetical protein DSUL_100064 [Desulfovibrionales bacterium]
MRQDQVTDDAQLVLSQTTARLLTPKAIIDLPHRHNERSQNKAQ